MAEGDILSGFQVTDIQVNSIANTLFYIIIAIIGLIVLGYVVIRWIEKQKHNIHVTLNRKMGNSIIKEEDWVMKEYYEGQYFFHYYFLNKRSPIIDDKYMKIVKKFRFGLHLPQTTYSVLGFDAYIEDGKIMPMEMNKIMENGTLKAMAFNGVDYDMFNFMKAEIEAFTTKKQKVDKLLQLAPYAMFLLIIVAFIVGQVLYTKHIESMAQIWFESVKQSTSSIIEQIGKLQVIPQG